MRHTAIPFKSFGSTLIFASYCGPALYLRWPTSEELVIECAAEKKPDFLLASYGSVKINDKVQSGNTTNRAF
jgi:hypothetical protein